MQYKDRDYKNHKEIKITLVYILFFFLDEKCDNFFIEVKILGLLTDNLLTDIFVINYQNYIPNEDKK